MRISLTDYPGAYAFPNCLGITNKDRTLILTDRSVSLQAMHLVVKACKEFSCNVECDDRLPLRLQEDIPKVFNKKIKQSDVIILAAGQSWYQTKVRRKAKYQFRKRVVECYGLNLDMLRNGALCADYEYVARFTEMIAKLFKNGKVIHIITKGRTDLTAQIRNYTVETGLYRTAASGGNLPAGEVSLGLKEKSANGRIVVDLSIDIIGDVRKRPLTIFVEDGCIKGIEGGASKKLNSLLKRQINLRNIIEIGIGTNPYSILGRSILEDEKMYGLVHFGFGNNTYFGGSIDGPHYDGVLLDPIIEVDGRLIHMDKKGLG